MKRTITVHNLGNLPTAPLDDFNELQEDFKLSDSEKLAKLQMLILTRGFKYAFKAWKDPDGKLWIIDAHQRKKALSALRKAGFEIPEIPYEPIYAETKKEAVEEIAAYNSEFGRKNPDTLLFKKYEIDIDTIERFSLDFRPAVMAPEIAKPALFNPEPEDEIQEDEPDVEIPENESRHYISLPGDIWLLGNHRLMCGDCRQTKAVAELMDGKLADICVTDPPYNVNYEGKTGEELSIDNDSMENDLFRVFLRQAFTIMLSVMKEGAPAYIFHADNEGANFRSAFKEAGFKFSQCCIWVKNTVVMGRQDYQWKHEPCLYGWKPGTAHPWFTDRKQSTVWAFDKPHRNSLHPTMKPIALMAYPIRNSSDNGAIVIDFFSGSGSTLMACQQIDRICHAMEIDPRYTDATVYRFKTMYRNQPIRLIRDGVTLSAKETAGLLNR